MSTRFWQSEAIYLDGIRHTLGDEYLSSPVKLKEIYDSAFLEGGVHGLATA